MASLALSVVGSMVGGPIGGMIGGAIGGLADNVLFPAKVPPPPAITASTYGNAITRAWGTDVRIGVNMIWTSGWKKQTGKNAKLASKKGMPPAYSTDIAVAAGRGPWRPSWCVKILANGNLLFDSTLAGSPPAPDSNGVVTWTKSHGTHKDFDTLVVYPGNTDQLPDPTIEAARGVGNVPAYIGTAYLVINGLTGTPFGNAVPILNIICSPTGTITLAEICAEISGDCGLDTNEISTSSLSSAVQGYLIESQVDGVTALQPLALCYNFDVAEVAGGLRFSPRGLAPVCTIENSQLAGHQHGSARPSFDWPRDSEMVMPKLAALTFIDPARDCQANTQSERRSTGSAQSNLSSTVKVTLPSDQARAIAARMLWQANTGRQALTAQTDDRLLWIESGRNYAVEVPGGYDNVRIGKRTRGANGVIEFDAKRDAPQIYGASAPGASAGIPANVVTLGGPVNPPVFVELPSTFPGVISPELRIALSGGDGSSANPAWGGCQVFWATSDVTGDYQLAGVQVGPSFMGKLTAGLATYGGSNPDTGHTLSISTAESLGEPAAMTPTDAANGLTAYMIGSEILTAELVSALGANAFNLTRLWRPLHDSSAASHSLGDAIVRIDSGLFRFPLPPQLVAGAPIYFRFVGEGESLAGVTTYSHTPNGRGYGTGVGGVPATPAAPAVTYSLAGNTVAWSDPTPADNTTTATILRAPGSGASIGSAAVIGTVAAKSLSYIDATAVPSTAYTYFVKFNNVIGASTGSAGTNAATPATTFGSDVTINGNLHVTGTIQQDTGTD